MEGLGYLEVAHKVRLGALGDIWSGRSAYRRTVTRVVSRTEGPSRRMR